LLIVELKFVFLALYHMVAALSVESC